MRELGEREVFGPPSCLLENRLQFLLTVKYRAVYAAAMNIFAVHLDPTTAAQSLCDKHVVKMLLESAQMLCTVAHGQGINAPYKAVHAKHPCTLWAGESADNYRWLHAHAHALAAEYTHRYGRKHKSERVVTLMQPDLMNLPDTGLTPHAQAMPEQYKHERTIIAYRKYYWFEKRRFAKWTNRTPPSWWLRLEAKQ